MSGFLARDAVDGDVWLYGCTVTTGGPERVYYDKEPDPTFRRRPVGFLADLDQPVDPLVWEGDDS